jgi:hypothetical protein
VPAAPEAQIPHAALAHRYDMHRSAATLAVREVRPLLARRARRRNQPRTRPPR